jgi:hypothetical protein
VQVIHNKERERERGEKKGGEREREERRRGRKKEYNTISKALHLIRTT